MKSTTCNEQLNNLQSNKNVPNSQLKGNDHDYDNNNDNDQRWWQRSLYLRVYGNDELDNILSREALSC